jgi:hypothetical protein
MKARGPSCLKGKEGGKVKKRIFMGSKLYMTDTSYLRSETACTLRN